MHFGSRLSLSLGPGPSTLRPTGCHLSPTHLLLCVQVQEVGGIQAPVHALLVPGQPAADRLALGGRPKHELLGFVHFHRWGWGPLLLLDGGRGCISPRALASRPSAGPQCRDAGRAGRTTHRFLFGERTEAVRVQPAPPPAAHQAMLGGSGELCALLLFCLACGYERRLWSQTAWVQILVPPLTVCHGC